MYQVILVDDEMLVRKRIQYGFDWESMGYVITGEADNGAEALELIEGGTYDLAVVDIAMPGMNGIELARVIRERNIPIHMIFLTGLSEFKYAQEAVRYGVHDYILKPIHEEEFCAMLVNLSEKIRLDREKNDLQVRAGAVVEAKIFSDFFHDTSPADETGLVKNLMEKRGMLRTDSYYVILYRGEQYPDAGEAPGKAVECMTSLCDLCLPGEAVFMAVHDSYRDDMIVMIRAHICLYEEVLSTGLEEIRLKLIAAAGNKIQCGMSRCHHGYEGLKRAYGEAVSALNNAKVLSAGLMTYEQVERRSENHYRVEEQTIKDLCREMDGHNFEGCRNVVRDIFYGMFERKVSFECISVNVNRLFLKLMDMGVISELDLKKIMNGAYNFDEVFENMSDAGDVSAWFEGILYTLLESSIRCSTENKSLSIIEKTCSYIRDHYQETDLSQSKIAEAMAVTQSYLSGIFKKMMGVPMVSYITMIRMEKARELLLESRLEVREAAEAVGYGDEYYFSRSFKKYYGMSPLHVKKIAETKRIKGN